MPTVADRPMSVKLPPWLDEELRREFEERGVNTSEGLRRVLEEWWVGRHLPRIEFREGLTGRRAALRDGPEVWEVAAVLEDYGEDREGLAEHFGWLDPEALEAALAYRERFPERVEAQVAENERVGRRLADRLG